MKAINNSNTESKCPFPQDDSKAGDIFVFAEHLTDDDKRDAAEKTYSLLNECIQVQLSQHAPALIDMLADVAGKQSSEFAFPLIVSSVGHAVKKGMLMSFMFNFLRCLGYDSNSAVDCMRELLGDDALNMPNCKTVVVSKHEQP